MFNLDDWCDRLDKTYGVFVLNYRLFAPLQRAAGLGSKPSLDALADAYLVLLENEALKRIPEHDERLGSVRGILNATLDIAREVSFIPPTVFRACLFHLGDEVTIKMLRDKGWKTGKCPCGECGGEETAILPTQS